MPNEPPPDRESEPNENDGPPAHPAPDEPRESGEAVGGPDTKPAAPADEEAPPGADGAPETPAESEDEETSAAPPEHSENLRQLVHMGTVAFILLIPLFGSGARVFAFVMAASGVVFNFFILPRTTIGTRIFREGEGLFGPVRMFPLALLSGAFYFKPAVLAAAWTVLAIGDGMSNLVGRAFGSRKLPWNPKKSYAGSIAGFLCSLPVCVFFIWYIHALIPEYSGLAAQSAPEDIMLTILLMAFAAAGIGMLAESFDMPFDDNFTVLQGAGAAAYVVALFARGTETLGSSLDDVITIGVIACGALGVIAYLARAVTGPGALAGSAFAFGVFIAVSWRGFALLVLFVVVGSVASHIGGAHKRELGAAQEDGGRRGVRHAVANLSVAAALALVYFILLDKEPLSHVRQLVLTGFVAAIATALADTLATEVGLLSKRKPVLVTHWGRSVEPGTNGGITRTGLLAALCGAGGLALVAWLLRVGEHLGAAGSSETIRDFRIASVLAVTAGGLLGCLFDSLLGATVEGKWRFNNHVVNFLATAFGAAAAGALFWASV